MGRDKATLRVGGETLARRSAALLSGVCRPALEVGPGHSGLEVVEEDNPGCGPLAALSAARRALCAAGFHGPALVLATDLPRLSSGLLAWLVDHPTPLSVVPVVGDRPQLLCARWSAADLDRAVRLVGAGRRSMTELLDGSGAVLAGPEQWAGPAGGAGVLDDADTPEDLARLGVEVEQP